MACQLVSAKPLFPPPTLNGSKSNSTWEQILRKTDSFMKRKAIDDTFTEPLLVKYVTGTNGMNFYLWNMQYYVHRSKSAAILDLRRISYTGGVHWYRWLGANALEFRLFCIKPSICNMSCTYGSICLDLVDIILLRNVFYYDMQISWPDSGSLPIRLSDS